MNTRELETVLRQGESLSVEFKSDQRCLPDKELVASAVSLANTEGGDLLLGVEDDGTVTGLHVNHLNVAGIPSLIANKTTPAISVRSERFDLHGKTVARITVPKYRQLVSTSDGLLVRRRLKLDGTPEAVPFYPHEFIQRQSSIGLVDPSAMVLEDVEIGQLDPLQRLRIRNAIKKYGGEQPLLGLSDEELDGALGLIKGRSGKQHPTVAGLLLLGTEDLLRTHLPAYEIAFQVLIAPSLQKSEAQTRIIIEILLESGLIEAHGSGRGRSYTLSAGVYQRSGQKAAYVRQAGFDALQQEQMVLKFIQAHGQIKRADVMDLCHLNGPQAYRLLKKYTDNALIIKTGERKHAVYTRK